MNIEELRNKAEAGNSEAQCQLGLVYYEGNDIPKNYREAYHWYQKASAQGHLKAMLHLGRMYYNGEGCKRDTNIAMEWIEKAANGGLVDAYFYMGLFALDPPIQIG